MRRPVIVAAEGEVEDLLNAARAALVCLPRTLKPSPWRCGRLPMILCAAFGEHGHAWITRNHDRRHLAQRLPTAIEEVCFADRAPCPQSDH